MEDFRMMIRLLSVLPGFVGVVCTLIVIFSLVGYSPNDSGAEVPIIPCTDSELGCNVGMTQSDMGVPTAFILLDIDLEVRWDEPDRAWLGVVDSGAAAECPPDSNGLTQCTWEDMSEYLVAGGPDSHDSMVFEMDPGKYRFVSAGKDGASLDSQQVVMHTSIHLNNYVEIALGAVSILLLAGAGEMAFPIRNLWKRFMEA